MLTKRLAIGIHPMSAPGTGVATYSSILLKAASQVGLSPMEIDAAVIGRSRTRPERWLRAISPWPRWGHHTTVSLCFPDIFREAQVFFDIHRGLMPLKCDGAPGVVHWTYPVPLYLRGWRNVYTIHDLIPLTAPELTPIDQARQTRLLRRICAVADAIVTVSEDSRRQIAQRLSCSPGILYVLGQAVDASLTGAAELAEEPYPGLTRRGYFLCCGTVEPRKNLARIIAAHARSGSKLPLILAGPDGWRAEEINAAARLRADMVVRLGHLPRPELLRLMAGARALIMPSLGEGFGLPVAEAMTLGVPVITSDGGALAEVAGDAAILVNPEDLDMIAAAIRRIGTDDELFEALSRRGFARATRFALRPYGARLSAFYDRLAR